LLNGLEWLWDVAVEPALSELGYGGLAPADGELPRVWWVPGGLLSLLPIHAAGYHTAEDKIPRTALDHVVSSYAPTIRVLSYARHRGRRPAVRDRSLIIAMPTTPGLPGRNRLPGVTAEAELLQACLPAPVRLAEPDPVTGPIPGTADILTRSKVLALLPECAVAHFSCHGYSDLVDPSRSFLALHDHDTAPFTVGSLTGAHLENVQLAYLSACTTAMARAGIMREEVIHLATAFQLAGFPHVIGTLWNVNDRLALAIARDFYAGLTASPDAIHTSRAARALHHAVLRARQAFPATPSLWAAYIHAGI